MTQTKTKTNDKEVKLKEAPELTLNMTDKVYLALARRSADMYSYVYALVLKNANKPGERPTYPMMPETEVSVFTNPKKADIYYNAASQVMEIQKKTMKQFYDVVVDWCSDNIARFNAGMGVKSR